MASVKYQRKKVNTTQEKLPRHKRQDRTKKRIKLLTFKLEYTSRTNLFLGNLLIFGTGHCVSDLTLHDKEKYRVYIFMFCYHKQEFSCNLINIKNSISSLTHDKLEIIQSIFVFHILTSYVWRQWIKIFTQEVLQALHLATISKPLYQLKPLACAH